MTSITNNSDNGRTQTFGYDPLNRISSATTTATSGVDCWGQNFTPDALANLNTMSVSQCSAGSLSVTVDGNNHINSSSTFAYDAAGNMTQDGGGFTYTFDAENRLTLASGMSGGPYCYVYDGLGLRVAKKSSAVSCSSGTVTKLYWRSIAGNSLAETDGSGSTTNSAYNEYVFFTGRRIASRKGTGAIFYWFADQLGSTRTITTGSGTGQTPGQLCYDADFTPYGQEISYTARLQTTACPPSYKFTGYERDPETTAGATDSGLDYAFARYYSSRLGRFLSTDPLGGSIGDLQSNNAYSYTENNPLNLIDPSGMGGCPSNAPQGTNCGPPQLPGCYSQGYACSGGGLLGDFGACTADGAPVLCSSALMTLQAGAGAKCSNNDCSQLRVDPVTGQWQQFVPGIPPGVQPFPMPCQADPGTICTLSAGYWVDVNVITIIVKPGNTGGGSTLDDRANALARAINKTGAQSAVNPCTVAGFYTGSAIVGAATSGEVYARAADAAMMYWPTAFAAGYNWLYRQSLRGDAIANLILTLGVKYSKVKTKVINACNAMQ